MLFGSMDGNVTYNVQEAEGYNESYAFGMISLESILSEGAMLDRLMRRDIQEATAIRESDELGQISILQEGVKEIGNTIKNYVAKVWEKIKALFSKFLAKLNGVIMRDTKALFKKYQDQWTLNANKKIKKWKFKKLQITLSKTNIEAETDAAFNKIKSIFSDIKTIKEEVSLIEAHGTWGGPTQKAHYDPKSYKYSGPDHVEPSSSTLRGKAMDGLGVSMAKASAAKQEAIKNDIKELEDKISDNQILEEILESILGKKTDKKSFAKDFDECAFADEQVETDAVVPSDIRAQIQDALNNNKLVSDIQTLKSKIDTKYSQLLREIDKQTKVVLDKEIANPTVNQFAMRGLNVYRRVVQINCEATNMVAGGCLKAAKFHVAQCRRVFMQVVAGKHVKEDVTLLDAIGEAAEYEVYSSFEEFE